MAWIMLTYHWPCVAVLTAKNSAALTAEKIAPETSARLGLYDMFLGEKGCLITVIKMSFLEKAKKKAEEEAKKAADAAKNAGEKGAQGAKTAGGKVKEAGEKGVEETKKAVEKAKEKID